MAGGEAGDAISKLKHKNEACLDIFKLKNKIKKLTGKNAAQFKPRQNRWSRGR